MWIPPLVSSPRNSPARCRSSSTSAARVRRENGRDEADSLHRPGQTRHVGVEPSSSWAWGNWAARVFTRVCMNQLDLSGPAGWPLSISSMKRSLDLLLSLPNVDPNRVAVTGLSGGGWQTIFINAASSAGDAGQSRGGLLQCSHPHSIPDGFGRFGAGPLRPGLAGRLHPPNRNAGPAADIVNQKRQGRLLFCRGPFAGPAHGSRPADLRPLRTPGRTAVARQRQPRHAQL